MFNDIHREKNIENKLNISRRSILGLPLERRSKTDCGFTISSSLLHVSEKNNNPWVSRTRWTWNICFVIRLALKYFIGSYTLHMSVTKQLITCTFVLWYSSYCRGTVFIEERLFDFIWNTHQPRSYKRFSRRINQITQ